MTWEDRAWLARLLAARRDQAPARALLASLWQDVGTVGARVEIPDSLLRQYGFPSRLRPAARLLEATLAVDPSHPRTGALVEHLVLRARATRDWVWNTQDLAASAAALADVARLQRRGGRTVTVRVRSGDGRTPVLTASGPGGFARGDSADVSLDGLLRAEGDSSALPLVVESDGGAVFWVLTVAEVPLARPVTPDVRGIVVERWYERVDDGKPVTEVRAGDLVRVHLRVTVPAPRDFVVVEDALPAGLEAVDAALLGSGAQLEALEPPSDEQASDVDEGSATWRGRDDWGGWWSPWEHQELRDERALFFARSLERGSYRASYVARATTPGRYVRPPAWAEEMYDPASNGRSDGGWFTVTATPSSSVPGGR
jgi:hypothetical protein